MTTVTAAKGWFTSELQSMMFALGDSKRPNLESVNLMEELIFKQLVSLNSAAQNVADDWYNSNSSKNNEQREFTGEDLVYLLRKDELLIKRLISYIRAKDQTRIGKTAVESSTTTTTDIVVDDSELPTETRESSVKNLETRRLKMLRRAFERFDVTGEYSSMLDEDLGDPLNKMRMERIFQRTGTMDANEYLQFTDARQTSFSPRHNHRKFRDWLFGPHSPCSHCCPDQSALEILNFLAHETLSTIMDFALIVKEETANKSSSSQVRVRLVEGSIRSSNPASSPQVAMALAQKVRENQLAGSGPKYLRVGIDALQAATLQPEEIREAIRRVKSARQNSVFPAFSLGF